MVPCPPLTGPLDDMMNVLLVIAVMKCLAWYASGHFVCPRIFDNWVQERVIYGGLGVVIEDVTNHEPFISKLDVCWLKKVVYFIGWEIGITKLLGGSSGGSKFVFNCEAASYINQSIRGGVDVKEIFL